MSVDDSQQNLSGADIFAQALKDQVRIKDK